MEKTTKLTAMPYAQARVRLNGAGATLISYSTTVASIDHNGWLTVYGLHSMTTRRHIGAFMKEYAPAPLNYYQVARDAYKGGYRLNLYTAEVEFLGK